MNQILVFTLLASVLCINYSFGQDILNCGLNSGTCDRCVKSSSKCYYCDTDRLCRPYPYQKGFPTLAGECSLREARWATCTKATPSPTLNLLVMVVLVGIAGALLLLSVLVCTCWCCIRKRRNRHREWQRLEDKQRHDKEEREAINKEKQDDRKAKWEGLRTKYGLTNQDEED